MSKIDREILKSNGWQMGACFTQFSCPELVSSMAENHSQDESFVFIAITHDCAIINDSLIAEPFLEYIVARKIGKLDGNFTHTKNPRKLHIELEIDNSSIPFELNIIDRAFLNRALLLKNKPVQHVRLIDSQKATLVRWLANRYMGQALPDQFEKRIDPVRGKLNKLLSKTEANGMLAIYIELNPRDELASDKNYTLTVALIYEEAAFRKLIDEDCLDRYVDNIKVAFQNAPGIDISGVVPLSEKDFPLYDQRRKIRWRSDHSSFKQNMDDVEMIEDP
ncbi:hypothetical protein [Methylobacter sp.]|uniref:hypothetical protein n=1 Tax=Methylobacter sp. TaxID=2051955 RepID=UPI0011FF99D9|nr:hypothetical protein [Methylobacter sp.]TAK63193.1 MAG: hypothetical protein EPO18_07730 [Methylobacter sp.]